MANYVEVRATNVKSADAKQPNAWASVPFTAEVEFSHYGEKTPAGVTLTGTLLKKARVGRDTYSVTATPEGGEPVPVVFRADSEAPSMIVKARSTAKAAERAVGTGTVTSLIAARLGSRRG